MKKPLHLRIFNNLLEILHSAKFPKPLHLLLAVSGGADSICMLLLIFTLRKKLNCKISVITVNHNIRDKNISMQDTLFVLNLCRKLSAEIECIVAELPEKAVFQVALLRKKGIEDAARFLRYKEFEKAKHVLKADFVLTAHTKNDLYETVLMRIFGGSNISSVIGISKLRGHYIRPMLDIGRDEIEQYLNKHGIVWRDDSTNFEQNYLRNKVRLTLVPALTEVFQGWLSGLKKTLEKTSLDNEFILKSFKAAKQVMTGGGWQLNNTQNKVKCVFSEFFILPPALKLRFLQEGLSLVGVKQRIPYSVISKFMKIDENFSALRLSQILLKKQCNILEMQFEPNTAGIQETFSKGFSIWIEKEVSFTCEAGSFSIKKSKNGVFIFHSEDPNGIGPFSLPFYIRSKLAGDTIETSGGSQKTLKKILNDWAVDLSKREIFPIVEKDGVIRALYGAAVGTKNWYVKEKSIDN